MKHKKLNISGHEIRSRYALHETAEFCAFSVRIAFLKLLIMPFKSTKRKQMALTVFQKLESIRKLEKGTSVTSV